MRTSLVHKLVLHSHAKPGAPITWSNGFHYLFFCFYLTLFLNPSLFFFYFCISFCPVPVPDSPRDDGIPEAAGRILWGPEAVPEECLCPKRLLPVGPPISLYLSLSIFHNSDLLSAVCVFYLWLIYSQPNWLFVEPCSSTLAILNTHFNMRDWCLTPVTSALTHFFVNTIVSCLYKSSYSSLEWWAVPS